MADPHFAHVARGQAALAAGGPIPTDGPLTPDELQLAARNCGMPLEALRYEITPTGLHYLLVHFDIPEIDPQRWRLRVEGSVEHSFALSLAELQALPRATIPVTMECAGNGRARLQPRPISQPWLNEAVGTAVWTGTPLTGVLARAGIKAGTVELIFTGADHGVEKGYEHDFARSLSLSDATRGDVLLAYEMNGRPLEPQHGFPVRLLVPGWYGMTQVKWLTRIEAVTEPFAGYQQRIAYFYRSGPDDPGTPVKRIKPRALMLPPGFPDFLTRHRIVERGLCEIIGRAWAGSVPIEKVEVGVDGLWSAAEVSKALGPAAWCGWAWKWMATPGEHILSCRATDAAGITQPSEPPWNWQGMGNNQIQSISVSVR